MKAVLNYLSNISAGSVVKEGITWIVVLSLWTYTIVYAIQVLQSYSRLTELKNTNAQLKEKVALLNNTNGLTEEEIDQFNAAVTQLIPEQEDYFLLVNSLENLANETGFVLSDYTIDLSDTSSEKLSLTVKGRGDREAFLRFLESYNFASGRLITIESIDYYLVADSQEYSFNLNFYTQKPPETTEEPQTSGTDPSSLVSSVLVGDTQGSFTSLTDGDIQFIKEIITKTPLQ